MPLDEAQLAARIATELKERLPGDPPAQDLDEALDRLAAAIGEAVVSYLKANAVPTISGVQTGTATKTGTLT